MVRSPDLAAFRATTACMDDLRLSPLVLEQVESDRDLLQSESPVGPRPALKRLCPFCFSSPSTSHKSSVAMWKQNEADTVKTTVAKKKPLQIPAKKDLKKVKRTIPAQGSESHAQKGQA